MNDVRATVFFSVLKLIAQTIDLMNQSEKGVHIAM